VEQWVKSIPKPKPGCLDKGNEQEMVPNQDSVLELPNNQDAEERAVGELQTWDMVELAQRGDLLSSEIKAARMREEELEKRVKEKQAKVSEKRDSVIMMNNVLKMKKDEVAKLRKRAATGRVTRRPSEPTMVAQPTQQHPSTAWPGRHLLSSQSPVLAGAGLSLLGSRDSRSWREKYHEESGDGKTGHPERINLPKVESCVEMGRAGVSLTETSEEELDQESRDWLARRHLKRENTWESKRASSTSFRSSPFKRTLSAPLARNLEPEVVELDKGVVASESTASLRAVTPHLQSGRHGASTRCYSCHELGHFARDCVGRKQIVKLHTARPTSAMVHISRRGHQEGGIVGGDVDRKTTRLESGPIPQKSVGYHLQKAGQLSRSEVGLLKNSSIGENSKKVGAPRSWANFTMDGMIADILSKREQ